MDKVTSLSIPRSAKACESAFSIAASWSSEGATAVVRAPWGGWVVVPCTTELPITRSSVTDSSNSLYSASSIFESANSTMKRTSKRVIMSA